MIRKIVGKMIKNGEENEKKNATESCDGNRKRNFKEK